MSDATYRTIEELRERCARLPVTEKSRAMREKRLDHRYGQHREHVRGCPDCRLRRLEV